MDIAENTNVLLNQYATGGNIPLERVQSQHLFYYQKKQPAIQSDAEIAAALRIINVNR
jgi:hypothetical protein